MLNIRNPNKSRCKDFGGLGEVKMITRATQATPLASFIVQKQVSSERNKGCEELEDKLGGSLEGGDDIRNGKPQMKLTKNNHPTVKPIALMEYLVKLVSKENAVVLDPFAGSGSTLVACKNTKQKLHRYGIRPRIY
jgi:DNA modification methylase